MKRYFCPRCGEDWSGDECRRDDERGLPRCPRCVEPRVLIQGRLLVVGGMLALFVSTFTLGPYIPVLGILIGGGLCLTGLIRALRRRRLRTGLEAELSEEESNDEDDPSGPS